MGTGEAMAWHGTPRGPSLGGRVEILDRVPCFSYFVPSNPSKWVGVPTSERERGLGLRGRAIFPR